MMRLLEAALFLSLAAGVHIGLWHVAPSRKGATSAGGAGAATVTLAAAKPQHSALARTWQAPPELAAAAAVPESPTADPAPQPPAMAAPARGRAPFPALVPAMPAALPQVPAAVPQRQTAPPQATAPAQPRPDPPSARKPAARPGDHVPRRAAGEPPRPPARPDGPARAETSPPPAPEPAKAAAERPGPPRSAAPASAGAGDNRRQNQPAKTPNGADAPQSLAPARRDALQARWGAAIQRQVHQRLIYPRGASGSGTARVVLILDRGGRLTGLRLTGSSGVAAFDRAALNAVRRAGRFPPAPQELRRESYAFTLSLSFRP